MNALVPLVVALPLLGAGIMMAARRWVADSHRSFVANLLSIGVAAVVAVASVGLFLEVYDRGPIAVAVGGWSPELGIVLVADMFAVLVLVAATVTILLVEVFALGQRRSVWGADASIAAPALMVLTAGVCLAILSGDLFTLFVAFELILIASYVLLTHQGRPAQIRSGMTYVAINLFASTLFLFGIAFILASTGTVNLALLAERVPALDGSVRVGIGLWFTVVFGTKAAIFPLFSWLPDSYPTAPTTITAIFAGLLTKIGVYCLIRFHTLLGMEDLAVVLLVVAAATILVGVAGALAQSDIKRILSFHIVSQIGYMLLGLGLFSVAGVAGAILFLVHQIPVKTVLFLAGGLVEIEARTSRLAHIGGLAARRPVLAALFAVPAMSLAGLPPTSGFVAKLSLIDAALDVPAMVAVASVGSLLTLLSMIKIWNAVFWGVAPAADALSDAPATTGEGRAEMSPLDHRITVGAASVAVAATLGVGLAAGALWDLSMQASTELLDGSTYVRAVRGGRP